MERKKRFLHWMAMFPVDSVIHSATKKNVNVAHPPTNMRFLSLEGNFSFLRLYIKANDVTKHLITGPLTKSWFVFPRISRFEDHPTSLPSPREIVLTFCLCLFTARKGCCSQERPSFHTAISPGTPP